MCGRFTIDLTADLMASAFQVTKVEPFNKRYNVAPTQTIPVIIQNAESGERVMTFMHWG